MSLTRKVAYNTIVQIIGKVVTTVISLFLVSALTRYLGVSGYGEYTTVMAYMALFSVFADFGFFWIYIREIAHPNVDINKATSNILTLRAVLGLVVYGIAILIGYVIPQYHVFQTSLAITALASFFLTLNSTYIGVFQNKMHMEKAAIADVVGRAVILAITLIFINMSFGLNAVLWAYAIGNIINFAVSFYFGRLYINFRPSFDMAYWKQIFLQALPMGITMVLGLIYFRIDTLMLSLMKTSTDVGIYGPPYKVLEIMLFLPSIFLGNVFPTMTRYILEKNPKIDNIIQKSFDFITLLAVPVVLGLVVTAKTIIEIVAGDEFVLAHTISPVFGLQATSVTALQILSVAVGLAFLSHLFGYLVLALGKQKNLVLPNIIFCIFNIGLNYLLIPIFSYIGAAFVTVLTEILVLFFSWRIAGQGMKLNINFSSFYKVLLSSLVLGIFLFITNNLINIIWQVVLGIVIYLSILILIKGFDLNTIREILGKNKNEVIE